MPYRFLPAWIGLRHSVGVASYWHDNIVMRKREFWVNFEDNILPPELTLSVGVLHYRTRNERL